MKNKTQLLNIVSILALSCILQLTCSFGKIAYAQENAKAPQCHCADHTLFGCNSSDYACQLYCAGYCADYCAKHPQKCKESGGSANDETLFATIFPNPVASSATISFSIDHAENVSVRIFDLTGRLIANLVDASLEEGDYEIEWSPLEVTAGNYLLQVQTTSETETTLLSVTK